MLKGSAASLRLLGGAGSRVPCPVSSRCCGMQVPEPLPCSVPGAFVLCCYCLSIPALLFPASLRTQRHPPQV